MKGFDIDTRPMGTVWTVVFALLVGAVGYHSYVASPDILLTASTNTTATLRVATDSMTVSIHQGDTLRFWGVDGNGRYLLETGDGLRGWGLCDADGPVDGDELNRYHVHFDQGYYFTSAKHVNDFCAGRTLPEIDRKWRRADVIMRCADGTTVAVFDKLAVFSMLGDFRTARMVFDEQGVFRHLQLVDQVKDRNCWLLSRLPFAETIMGCDWLMWLVQETYYDEGADSRLQWSWWRMLLARVFLFVVMIVLWPVLPMLLPMALLMVVLPKRTLRYVPTGAVVTLAVVLTAVWAYCWLIAVLCWGHTWLLLLPIACVMVVGAGTIMSSVLESESEQCCPQCGRRNCISLDDSKPAGERDEWREEEVCVRTYSKTNHFTKKHTVEVYIQSKVGSNDYETEHNVPIDYHETINYGEFQRYRVKYHIELSDNTYKCRHCSYTKTVREPVEHVVERQPIGDLVTRETGRSVKRDVPHFHGDYIDADVKILD
jgi:hypothetical protein